jgi:hypothetical protein
VLSSSSSSVQPSPLSANELAANAARSDAEILSRFASEIQSARDPAAEAAAIERMRRWMRDQLMTYQITTTRLDTDREVQSASTLAAPVRTDISVYRQLQPIYNFSFVPKDNRNLAMLGQ